MVNFRLFIQALALRVPRAGLGFGLAAALLLAGARVEARDMASILIDADSGVVLSALDATQPWHPASLTKMMTVYMAFGALADGTLTLEEELTVSETAAAQPETRIGLTAGKTISVEQAIKAVIVRSGNDAAVLLAERLGGSEAAFAAAMTNRALGLGMTRTKFVNASGLPDDGQITTARDMAILARHIIQDYPQYYGYFGSTSIVWRGKTLGTYNPLLGGFRGADGLKTGFTCASGYNIVGSAVRDGHRLIGVVLGGRSGGERNARVTKLLEEGFNGLQPAPDAPMVELMESEADVQPPPRQLSSAECSTVPSVAGPTRFEGWAVIFGYFPSKAAAQKAIQTARTQLKPVMSRGQPAVIQRQQEGAHGFAALLVGLKKEDAGTACKQLWGAGGYCMALNPEVLNNPTALWR